MSTDGVAYTTGTFDLVHEGHFEFFKIISQYYKKIIVGLVTDEFAEVRKRRPYLSYNHRKSILENSKYNIVVVPCNVSNKQLDYEKLRFDALFIEDGYYGKEEYTSFEKDYPHIPVYYLPRPTDVSRISTTNIITRMKDTLLSASARAPLGTACPSHPPENSSARGSWGTACPPTVCPPTVCPPPENSSARGSWGTACPPTVCPPTVCPPPENSSARGSWGTACPPINWNDLLPLHLTIVSKILPRSSEVTARYEEDKKTQKHTEYIDLVKHILANYDYILIDNNYLYNVSPDINHRIFWFKGSVSMSEAYDICKGEHPNHDIIVMCNDLTRKSILDIDHYHVFVKENNNVSSKCLTEV